MTVCVSLPLVLFGDETRWYHETLYPDWQQAIRIDRVLKEEASECQELIVFENETFGRVLAVDGIIQLTERDEFIYHEMMVHVPLLAHGKVENVLIIGGGDGGIVREVMRHKSVKKVTLVEIDPSVIALSKEYLPMVSRGAFDDPRLTVEIDDGSLFVKNTEESYDVILCDSTDPIGPGEVLFTEEFYRDCKSCLKEGGIFVNQNGAPFMQKEELQLTYERRKPSYDEVSFYIAPIPTYVGGFMAFGWATDDRSYGSVSVEELAERLKRVEGEMKYYTPQVHLASFALPAYISP
jgi:spermidine synthase